MEPGRASELLFTAKRLKPPFTAYGYSTGFSAWFKRRLQIGVAGVEDCGDRVSAFAPRTATLLRHQLMLPAKHVI